MRAMSQSLVSQYSVHTRYSPVESTVMIPRMSCDGEYITSTMWREAGGTHSLENGITTFKGSPDAAADEIVGHQLPTIDLHHGAHSHSPPWSVLEVYGAPPTTGLRAVLSEYGLTEVRATAHGFVATAPSVVSAG